MDERVRLRVQRVLAHARGDVVARGEVVRDEALVPQLACRVGRELAVRAQRAAELGRLLLHPARCLHAPEGPLGGLEHAQPGEQHAPHVLGRPVQLLLERIERAQRGAHQPFVPRHRAGLRLELPERGPVALAAVVAAAAGGHAEEQPEGDPRHCPPHYSASSRSCRTASASPARSVLPSRESVRMNAPRRRHSSLVGGQERVERLLRVAALAGQRARARRCRGARGGRPRARPGAPSAPSGATRAARRAPPRARSAAAARRSPRTRAPRPRPSGSVARGDGGRRPARGRARAAARARSRAPRARRAATSRSATSRRASVQLLAAELGRRRRELAGSPRARPRSSTPGRPARPRTRYQRVTASTSTSTPPISSACTSGSTLPSRLLDRLPVGLRADDLAGDPVGPHDLGGPGAALGHELGDEHRPERVDDEVGVDRREQLAPQRVLRPAARRSARPPAAGSSRAGRARATGRRAASDSSSDSLTRRFA